MKRWTAAWIAVLCVAPLALACAHETTTVTTTTTECPEHHHPDAAETECSTVVEETVVTTEADRCHGLVSCTFTVVGEVIALPFRIVGAAFSVVL